MYSDSKKFPVSGGYVWISESSGVGAANKFIPVYKGSLFEATNHKPTVVLKLIYHWACQTSISVRLWLLAIKKKTGHHLNNFFLLL